MHCQNYTPFCTQSWKSIDPQRQWSVSTLCRVKFFLKQSNEAGIWELQVDQNQGELFLTDMHYEDDITHSVRYESDFVPFKPYTDIIVNTKTYPYEKKKKWYCSVGLYDEGIELNRLRLQIKQPLFDTTPYVDVRYEHCKGGIIKIKHRGTEDEIHIHDKINPVGCGTYVKEKCHIQIEYEDKYIKEVPPGFGSIHRSWKGRVDYAGSYDETWLAEQHPLLPHDFDVLHYQAAHPMLRTKKYLQGGEEIELLGLMPHRYKNIIILPTMKFLSRVHTTTQIIPKKMNLDTLIIDLYDKETEAYHVYASWRSSVNVYDDTMYTEVMYVPNKEKKDV